jgi:hypothetical protein
MGSRFLYCDVASQYPLPHAGFSPIKVLGGTVTLPSPERQGGHEVAEK